MRQNENCRIGRGQRPVRLDLRPRNIVRSYRHDESLCPVRAGHFFVENGGRSRGRFLLAGGSQGMNSAFG